jgi:hypothetical protein
MGGGSGLVVVAVIAADRGPASVLRVLSLCTGDRELSGEHVYRLGHLFSALEAELPDRLLFERGLPLGEGALATDDNTARHGAGPRDSGKIQTTPPRSMALVWDS